MRLDGFAGSDSTASTMQSFFYHILKDAKVYEKIELELNEANRLGKLSEPIQYQESLQLPYFQAALKEAMRLRPAVNRSPEYQAVGASTTHMF